MRCIECGGPVVTIASTGCSARYFFRKRTLGRTQPTRGSGTNRLPRIHSDRRCLKVFFPDEISVTSLLDAPAVSVFISVDAPLPISLR